MTPARARVLVVDDEADVRDLLREFLETEGYEVLLAETAIGALGITREHRPHVILLDLNMPGAVQGDAIIGAVSREAPVIVITATIDEDVARQTLRDGAVDFIRKPFDLARVREVVEAALLR